MPATAIYHVCPWPAWRAARAAGVYRGGALDRRDGFIHFSTAEQVIATVETYLAGQPDLALLEVDPAALAGDLRWEASRGGAVFPHLYAALPVAAVRRVHDLPRGPDGRHLFPTGVTAAGAR